MKILNKFKSILIAVMVLGLFFTMGIKSAYAADADIASGIYEVENEVYHESETGMAMSRSYLLPTMEVEVTKDGIVYTIGFSGSDYMENYRMLVNGEDTAVEMVDEVTEEGIVKLKVEVDKVDADMDALIYVAPMGRDVQFKVIPKMETLTLIEAIEEAEEVIEEVVAEDLIEEVVTEVDATSGASENYKTMAVAGGVAVVVIAGIVAVLVIKAKKKK
ncbi:NEAT domain-containing protein [Clostridium sp. NSJ-145]|uniref:NEAT domain-containing protein n=1 Tax=Clostridium sp. NSJ-145 TaxID=2897777 RepID=UPI001E54B66A|nr:NEAT domain-containing protein [Clostridium sp. NSJ-145]MCD2500787.1 NEAT domain-containing protein [Clostridium sp. NSJ-145]